MKVNITNRDEIKEELTELVDGLQDGENLNVFKGKKKANIKEEFVMVFNRSFCKTMKSFSLSPTDLTVLFQVIEYVSYGNVINLTHQTIADDLDLTRPQVSKSFKKLKDAGIFVEEKKSLFLNPQYLVKGDLYKATDSEAYKTIRNKIYDELSPYFSGTELDRKVHDTLNFTK